MRLLLKVCVVAAVAAFVVAPALAQQPGRGGFGPMRLDQLLTNKSVQEELKLDKDQIAKITDVNKKFQEDNKDALATLRNFQASREERAEATKKVTEAATKAFGDTVKAEQMKRVKQIQLQQQIRIGGPAVYTNEEIAKALKLTDEQKEKIKTLADDLRKDREKLFADVGNDMAKRREANQKFQEISKEATEKVQKTLTDEQKKSLKEMQGEPFEIRFERPGGATPGRPGGDRTPPRKIDF